MFYALNLRPLNLIPVSTMRFYSKLVAICNVCFILAVIIRYLQYSEVQHANYRDIVILKPIESTLVILGYGAVLLNFIFCSLTLFKLITEGQVKVGKFIIGFNFIILLAQVYYFFLSEF